MTCVVVNDASCLIDLYKGRLLLATLELPYRFILPLPIRHSELLDLNERQWWRLDHAGLETFNTSARTSHRSAAGQTRASKAFAE